MNLRTSPDLDTNDPSKDPPDGEGFGGFPGVELLYRDQMGRILRYLLRRPIPAVEAHDLAHDAFQRLIQLGNANVNMLEKPEAYLQQIARNLVFDKIKTARRRSFHLHIQSDYAALEGPALEPQLEARDMLNRVEAAMQQLKPRTREVFMARRVDGLSYAEISEQTGLSFKIIEKEMARAIAHLQQLFGRG